MRLPPMTYYKFHGRLAFKKSVKSVVVCAVTVRLDLAAAHRQLPPPRSTEAPRLCGFVSQQPSLAQSISINGGGGVGSAADKPPPHRVHLTIGLTFR